MTKEKDFPSFGPTITAQTKDGTVVEIGSIAPDFSISLLPDVSFADLADHTILGSEHMHITTGCLKSGLERLKTNRNERLNHGYTHHYDMAYCRRWEHCHA